MHLLFFALYTQNGALNTQTFRVINNQTLKKTTEDVICIFPWCVIYAFPTQ